MLYSCPNVAAMQHEVALNTGTPTPMRGPGRIPALFAIESALDELAVKLNLDPLEVRLRNYAETDEGSGHPWSSKHLARSLSNRSGAIRMEQAKSQSRLDDAERRNSWLGNGNLHLAGHISAAPRFVYACWPMEPPAHLARRKTLEPAPTRFLPKLFPTKPAFPVDKVQVILGDSSLPPGPTSGGSSATASVIPAIVKATDNAVEAVLKAAAKTPQLAIRECRSENLEDDRRPSSRAEQTARKRRAFQEILPWRSWPVWMATQKPKALPEQKKYSIHSFGAHFCEVSYDPEIVRLRVTRWLTVIDGGRMINQKTARNQIHGIGHDGNRHGHARRNGIRPANGPSHQQ